MPGVSVDRLTFRFEQQPVYTFDTPLPYSIIAWQGLSGMTSRSRFAWLADLGKLDGPWTP